MRISAFVVMGVFLTANLLIAEPGRGQNNSNKVISVSYKKMSLHKIIKNIGEQADVIIMYEFTSRMENSTIDFEVKSKTLEETLDLLTKGRNLKWAYKKNIILIEEASETADQGVDSKSTPSLPPSLNTPPITVRGRIVNERREPVIASIIIKGTNRGTTTNDGGVFELSSVEEDAVLVISCVGYAPREVKAGANLVIGLDPSISKLDEIQIIAYGTSSKRFNTSNVSTVKAADIEKQPVSNPLATLQGRMSGVIITQNSGVPGSGFNVQIRGQNSLRPQGNAPFYIIDGVPFSSSNSLGAGGFGANQSYNPLNSINPADIESIDILKDADATAIYGSRGANGVVLITTKKGQAGKTKFDVNASTGMGKISRKIDLLNTKQYLEMRYEAFKNDEAEPQEWDYDLMQWDTTRYTNWQKTLIGGTAHLTNAQISVSGGNSNTQFVIGGGYRRESTVFPGDFADQKASVHFNITNSSANQKFKTLLTGSYVSDNNELLPTDLTSYAVSFAPNAPAIYDEAGNLNWENSTWDNPFAFLRQKYKGNVSNLIGNAVMSYQVTRRLQLKTTVGYNKIQMNEVKAFPLASINPDYWSFSKASSYFADNSNNTWIIEPQAEYQSALGRGKISTLIGATFQQNESKIQGLSATGFTSDALLENIQAASTVTVTNSNYIQYRYNAFFGRINYSLDNKYIINLTGRRDGSSRFGPGKQFSNFGSIGAAWVFSSEDIIQKALSFLSYGKLRGSYGITGNDQIPDYGYLDLWNTTVRSYGGIKGLYPNNLFSPDYAWEGNTKLEAGLELGFIKDRILLSVSYYSNRSDDQLIGAILPAITGFTSIQANLPAKVQNTGVELELNTINVKRNNIMWSTALNITIPRSKLINYPDLASSSNAGRYIVGQPLSISQLYHSVGINPETGVYEFEGENGEATSFPTYPADLRSLKNIAPVFYGGLSNSVQYRGLQLDIHFQFVKQLGSNYMATIYQAPGTAVNQLVIVMDRWQKPGDDAGVQKFTQSFETAYTAYDNAVNFGDNHISDASFLRLKNLSLSYQLPDNLRQRLRMQNCRIYIHGQNILTITNYLGMDPENQSMSILPPLRMITTGIQITF